MTAFLVCAVALLATGRALAAAAAGPVLELRVDSTHPGPVIGRNIFGQFAEHLGTGIYGGIWVGKDSAIPNVRGIRSDVVAALRALHVPNVRWPGGCFGDEYHWRDGIGPTAARNATVNANWGGAVETNRFGTDEFMDLISQIGSEAYLSVNVGSGTPAEAAAWLAYMTADTATSAGRERAANGHPEPYRVKFLGIGNESWGCGGSMSPDYYVSQMKIYARYVRNYNPAQTGEQTMRRLAGRGGGRQQDRLRRSSHEGLARQAVELGHRRTVAFTPTRPSAGHPPTRARILASRSMPRSSMPSHGCPDYQALEHHGSVSSAEKDSLGR